MNLYYKETVPRINDPKQVVETSIEDTPSKRIGFEITQIFHDEFYTKEYSYQRVYLSAQQIRDMAAVLDSEANSKLFKEENIEFYEKKGWVLP